MDEDFECVKLKDLSKHVCHARIWVNEWYADKALEAVTTGGADDLLMWHNWESNTNYQIDLSAMREVAIREQIANIKKAVPSARAHIQFAQPSRINFLDWIEA